MGDGFPAALLALDRRADLAAVIGPEAEVIVHRYASCDRTATYPPLADPDAPFPDRFTGRSHRPLLSPPPWQDCLTVIGGPRAPAHGPRIGTTDPKPC
ncbi:hypothetical protein GCM10027074_50730 [Streptomyces deserti]